MSQAALTAAGVYRAMAKRCDDTHPAEVRLREALQRGQFRDAHWISAASPDTDPALYRKMRKGYLKEFEHLLIDWLDRRRYREVVALADFLRSELDGAELDDHLRYWQDLRKHTVLSELETTVLPLLRLGKTTEADEAYSPIACLDAEGRYRDCCTEIEAQRMRELQRAKDREALAAELARGNLLAADEVYKNSGCVTEPEYGDMKAPHLLSYLQQLASYPVEDEKARVLALVPIAQNTLVEARAGSGKTTLLGMLVRLLCDRYGVTSDEILVLAFNRSAAAKIRDEIRVERGLSQFWNARTFHSLAYRIVCPTSETQILVDERVPGERYEQDGSRSAFIRKIWQGLRARHPILWRLVYHLLRAPSDDATPDMDPSSNEYLAYRRGLVYLTLRGEYVKSRGEKYIADFLLEHGIPYAYEPRVRTADGRPYRPDFTLDGFRVAIEHWAFAPQCLHPTMPPGSRKTPHEYLQEIAWKRRYWQSRPEWCFIQTNRSESDCGREAFEDLLKKRLVEAGVTCEKLPRARIKELIGDRHVSRTVGLLGQGISLARKAGLTAEGVRQLYSDTSYAGARVFGCMLWRVFREYERRMAARGWIDFEDLMLGAVRLAGPGSRDAIRFEAEHQVALSRLRWVLIDEYQDFSRAFSELVQKLRDAAPGLHVVCVGDNWQAINGFAGSDLRYYDDFETALPSAARRSLRVNLRSQPDVIQLGNHFMGATAATSALPGRARIAGKVAVYYVDDVPLEYGGSAERALATEADREFIVWKGGAEGLGGVDDSASRYLKTLCLLIERRTERSFVILTRTGRVGCLALRSLHEKLVGCLRQRTQEPLRRLRARVHVSTVHGYKGQEADVAIVLEVADGRFPLLHPHTPLLAPLGRTRAAELAEEKRLFYVAISRPRDELVLITERDDQESMYIQEALGAHWETRYLRTLTEESVRPEGDARQPWTGGG
jgi:DNA helicase-4